MSKKYNCVEHKGLLKEIRPDHIVVQIQQMSACANCHAKGICHSGDVKEKLIEIPASNTNYKIGDEVIVEIKESLAMRAVLLGYFMPFLIMIAVIFILLHFTEREGMSALIGIGALAPYYLILYMMRDRLKKTFYFQIKK